MKNKWWLRDNVILKNTKYPEMGTEVRIIDPTHVETFLIVKGERYSPYGNVLHIGQLRGSDCYEDIVNWINTGDVEPFEIKSYNDI